MKPTQSSSFLPSRLYTASGEETQRKVEEELKVPDPTEDEAIAAIEQAKLEKDEANES